MKKLFKLFMCIGLVFGLTACSVDDADADKDTGNSGEKDVVEQKEPSFGDTVEFDGLEITFTGDFEFLTLDNQFSDKNGADVVKAAASIKNISEEKNGINMFYVTVYGSKGTEIDDMSAYYMDDDMLFKASTDSLRAGASMDTYLHFVYDGDGDYYVSFSSWDSEVEVKLPITK